MANLNRKVLKKAIRSRMANDDTLTGMATGSRIYDRVAPPGTALPYIIFQLQGGGPDNLVPRELLDMSVVIKVVTTGYATTTAEDIMARIDTLFDDHALSVTGYTAFWCKREAPDLDYTEEEAGRIYRHIGGSFRIRLAAN